MISSEHYGALASLLGEQGFLTTLEDMYPYQMGARNDQGRAAFVARPQSQSEAEMSALLGYCCRAGLALIPQSGNTGVVSGSTPDTTGNQGIVSLDRFKKRFDLDRGNRSVTVDAGFRLSEINRRLEEYELFFPIDLSADPCAGGMVATNTGGTRLLRYGDVRRNTLGLKVVLGDADGTVLELGRGLRKDNTGPDWKQVFIGTAGAFGVVTECTFNLERVPSQSVAAYLVPRTDQDVMEILDFMEKRFGSDLSAFEGMSGSAIAHALNHASALRNPFSQGEFPHFVILAELSRASSPREGEPTLYTLLEAALVEMWTRADGPLINGFVGRPQEMWALRHVLSEGVKAAGHLVAFDLAFRRSAVMNFRSRMHIVLAEKFPDVDL